MAAIVIKKKKSKWVLQLRVAFFLVIPLIYLIISTKSVADQSEWNSSRQYFLHPLSRKLLSSHVVLEPGVVRPEKSLFNHNQEKVAIVEPILIDESAFLRLDPSVKELSSQENCTPPTILEFPADGFTKEQRREGFVIIHCLIACYCFWLIAIVCDDYFVPVIDCLCENLQMKKDIAGATFMAIASSSSELFINCVGTFITEGDIGVGTIVGSAVFNILAVPACCGLIAGQVVMLDWWPVTRDCLMYGFAVIALIVTLLDGKIMWYESLCLVLACIVYIIAISCNDSIARKIHSIANMYRKESVTNDATERTPLMEKDSKTQPLDESQLIHPIISSNDIPESVDTEPILTPWELDPESCFFVQALRWPIIFMLWATIPDCRKRPSYRCCTFFVCIFWIGAMSYVVAYMITIIGDTLNIPDSVMGLTFLAAGTSIPEAVSSVIVTNQGHGTMGISNSIGSNTFDILLCLGLPWLIKSLFFPTIAGAHYITMKSKGMAYSAGSLLSTLCGLYCAFIFNKFKLDWKVGVICSVMYILFLIFASLIELNVFFPVNLPTCVHD